MAMSREIGNPPFASVEASSDFLCLQLFVQHIKQFYWGIESSWGAFYEIWFLVDEWALSDKVFVGNASKETILEWKIHSTEWDCKQKDIKII